MSQFFKKTVCLCLLLVAAATACAAPASAQLSQAFGGSRQPNANELFRRNNQQQQPHPILGPWTMTKKHGQHSITIDIVFKPNGNVSSIVKVSAPGQDDKIETDSGSWKIQGDKLIIEDEENREEVPFNIENGQLYVQIPQFGQTLVMSRPQQSLNRSNIQQQFRQTQNQRNTNRYRSPNHRTQPNNSRNINNVSRHPLAGDWYFNGQNGSVSLAMKISLGNDGTANFATVVRNGDQTQPWSSKGTWSIEGNILVLKSNIGTERIPFEFNGGPLILDFSKIYGIKISMSRQPGQSRFYKSGNTGGNLQRVYSQQTQPANGNNNHYGYRSNNGYGN